MDRRLHGPLLLVTVLLGGCATSLREAPEMSENALYYTFSTIAQSLAGALAVLVAVVLFRMTSIDDSMASPRSFLQDYANKVPVEEGLNVLRKRGGVRRLLELMKSRGVPDFDRMRVVVKKAHDAWQVRPRLRWAVGVSVADISLCFVALPFSPAIACSVLAWPIATAAVLLGVICLALYVRLIFALVANPE